MLNQGNYCKECSNKEINELYNEILSEKKRNNDFYQKISFIKYISYNI